MTPDVSVIVPTFRREAALVRAVESGLAQDGVAVEVIVVDDSPEGSARAAVESLDSRVRYVHRDEPSGGRPALVRADGARLARGRYLLFLDDDDVLEPGALGALANALDERRTLATPPGVAFGVVTPVADDPAVLAHERRYFDVAAERARHRRTRYGLAAALLFHDSLLVCSACMIRRDLAERVRWDPEIAYCEDGDFFLRAIRADGFVFVDRPVLRYRAGESSLMHTALRRRDAMRASYARIHEKYRRAHGPFEFWALRAAALFF